MMRVSVETISPVNLPSIRTLPSNRSFPSKELPFPSRAFSSLGRAPPPAAPHPHPPAPPSAPPPPPPPPPKAVGPCPTSSLRIAIGDLAGKERSLVADHVALWRIYGRLPALRTGCRRATCRTKKGDVSQAHAAWERRSSHRLLLDVRGRLARARRIDLNLDLTRLRLGPLGQPDAEDAILALGGDVLGVDGRRKREAALESAVGALDPLVPVLRLGLLELALAAQGQRVVLDVEIDLGSLDFGQLDLEGHAIGVLEDID